MQKVVLDLEDYDDIKNELGEVYELNALQKDYINQQESLVVQQQNKERTMDGIIQLNNQIIQEQKGQILKMRQCAKKRNTLTTVAIGILVGALIIK
jgi:hypothetical protein